MEHFEWERQAGRSEHNGIEWDELLIADREYGLVTGDWIVVPVADLDAFIAWVTGIRDEVQRGQG